MSSEKKPNATKKAVIFSGLSLFLSLNFYWVLLVTTHKWPLPLWNICGYFASAVGWLFNFIFVVIAVISIIVAFRNREQKKRTLWLSILMLIPGVLYICQLFLFFLAVLLS